MSDATVSRGCRVPGCADGFVPSQPDGQPEPCPWCSRPALIEGTDIKNLSVSQVGSHDRCRRAWAYNRIAKIGALMPGRVHSGSAMDAALNWYWNERIAGRKPRPEDMAEVFSMTLHKILSMNEFLTPDHNALDDGRRMCHVFVDDPDIQRMQPVETQRRIEYELGGVFMVGYVDLITAVSDTAQGLGYIVADHKFTSRTPNEDKVQRSLQLVGYSKAIHVGSLAHFPAVRLINLVRLKREPKVVIQSHFVTEKQIRDAERHVKNTLAAMRSRRYPMVSPENAFVCGPDECSYWDICRGQDDGPTPIPGEITPE